MFEAFFYLYFFGMPLAIIAYFGISLYRYISARIKNKKANGSVAAQEIRSRKIHFVISSILMGALILLVAGIVVLLSMAITLM